MRRLARAHISQSFVLQARLAACSACPVMADSNPTNDTVTVNIGTLSNAIASAIQQSRTQSSASTSATGNSGPPQTGRATPTRELNALPTG